MEGSKAGSVKELPLGIDVTTEEEYTLQSKLLKEFTSISSIDKAWIFKSDSGMIAHKQTLFMFLSQANTKLFTISFLCKHFLAGINSQALFSISQANLLANKRRKFILSGQISKESNASVNFQWAPFPVEMTGASIIVPSPSGAKLLVVRNSENESPSQIEIWGPSQLEKEFHVPQSIHGSIYTDGW